MTDKATWSVWDHITGECFQGKHKGRRLNFWPISMTTAEAAQADFPNITVSLSGHRSLRQKAITKMTGGSYIKGKGFIPPNFNKTMATRIDPRLDKLSQGLGVIDGDQGKFYQLSSIPRGGALEDVWHGRPLRVERRRIDGIPKATWTDTNEVPMQLLTRWYGFAFTYPRCEIF